MVRFTKLECLVVTAVKQPKKRLGLKCPQGNGRVRHLDVMAGIHWTLENLAIFESFAIVKRVHFNNLIQKLLSCISREPVLCNFTVLDICSALGSTAISAEFGKHPLKMPLWLKKPRELQPCPIYILKYFLVHRLTVGLMAWKVTKSKGLFAYRPSLPSGRPRTGLKVLMVGIASREVNPSSILALMFCFSS